MTTITLKVSTATARWLDDLSKRSRRTKSEIIRQAIDQLRRRAQPESALEVAGDVVGRVASGKRDLGSNKAHLRGFGR